MPFERMVLLPKNKSLVFSTLRQVIQDGMRLAACVL